MYYGTQGFSDVDSEWSGLGWGVRGIDTECPRGTDGTMPGLEAALPLTLGLPPEQAPAHSTT